MRRFSIVASGSVALVSVGAFALLTVLDRGSEAALAPLVVLGTLVLVIAHASLIVALLGYGLGSLHGLTSTYEIFRHNGGNGHHRSARKRVLLIGLGAAAYIGSRRGFFIFWGLALTATATIVFVASLDLAPDSDAVTVVSMVVFAALLAGLAMIRSVTALVSFGSRSPATRRFLLVGSFSKEPVRLVRPRGSWDAIVRSLDLRATAVVLLPGAVAAGLALAKAPPAVFGLLAFAVVAHLTVTTWRLFTSSRRWWRQLRVGSLSRTQGHIGFTNVPDGTLPLTMRVLVDIVTPLGPSHGLINLSGVLSEPGALVTSGARWTIVVEPDRLAEIETGIAGLFRFANADCGDRVRVVAHPERAVGPKRNAGALLADAPFLAFVDADDRVDLAALAAATRVAISHPAAFHVVHSFPTHRLTRSGLEPVAAPRSFHARFSHHHSGRLWPTSLFRSGTLRYPSADLEDAILALEVETSVGTISHSDMSLAFFTYADHREDEGRITRRPKDATAYLRMLAERAAEAETSISSSSGATELGTALLSQLTGRVAAELAWGRTSVVEVFQGGAEALQAYYDRDVPAVVVDPEHLRRHWNGVKNRISENAEELVREGLLSYAADELSSRAPHFARPANASTITEGAHLGLMSGLLAVSQVHARTISDRPTVLFNLSDPALAGARQAVDFTFRGDWFDVVEDRSLPLGEVDVVSRSGGSQRRVGSFKTDPTMTSKLLRLWKQHYPEQVTTEQVRSAILLHELRIQLQGTPLRLFGTGPSGLAKLSPEETGDQPIGVFCNSWVRQPELMARHNGRILTAGDPIFHAGPSPYAHRFREDLAAWLAQDPEHLFVTVARDIAIYLRELPSSVHQQIVSVDFLPAINYSHPVAISSGTVQPFNNVLTLLMLPLAEHLAPSSVELSGFDGGVVGEQRFWGYEAQVNYDEALQQTVREMHPEFFRVDYQQYRDGHDDHVKHWMDRLVGTGARVVSVAASNIPAINAAYLGSEGGA